MSMENPASHGPREAAIESASHEARSGHSRRPAICESEAGGALVELVLLMVFLLVPVFIGMVDFGQVFYASIEVNNAATAGVSYGAQNSANYSDLAGMRTAAANEAANITGLTTTAQYSVCTNTNGIPSGCCVTTTSGTTGTCPTTSTSTFVQVTTSATVKEILTQAPITVHGFAVMRTQ